MITKDKVKVGCKFGQEHFAVECSIKIPQTIADAVEIASFGLKSEASRKLGEEFVVKMFERGWRIWCQEQSGARDFIQQSTVKQREDAGFPALVQAIIDKADPTAPPQRTGRPAKQPEVTLTPEMFAASKKGDSAKLAELLAAQGIKVNITQK